MKRAKKITASVLSVLLVSSALASCKPPQGTTNTQKFDATKAQLRICSFDGGVGVKWLEDSAERFCELYKDHVFVEGTKGVQIWIEPVLGVDVNKFPNENNDIYFAEHANYYNMLSTGHLLEITDMVTEPMTEFGETESVEDKLYDNYKDYFKTPAGKYYAIPHYKGIYGITYDRVLWNEKSLFIGANGAVDQKETGTLANGPDGMPNTYDDGLPATYDDFYKVCDTMMQRGITPITWSGMYQWYFSGLLAALKADFEGEQADLSYSFNGETYDKLVKSINPDGTVVYDEPLTITEENGYEMMRSAGDYYALTFAEKIIDSNYYAQQSFTGSVTHLDVQGTYLLSKYSGKRIGMLVEGSWWANEAGNYIQRMQSSYGDTLDARGFALMPYPKATTAEVGDPQTVLDTANSLACINAHIDPETIPLAKLFLQFQQTESELIKFVQSTSMTRNFKYEVPEDVYDGLNTFAKSIVDVCVNCEHVLPMSSSQFMQKNLDKFQFDPYFKTPAYGHATDALNGSKHNKTAAEVFAEMQKKFTPQIWNSMR
ncbi:MAG: hypothetical protein E7381_05135 [Clostridiales bacterium]|nr:hypothetical protein [Clostridiales bacterium]